MMPNRFSELLNKDTNYKCYLICISPDTPDGHTRFTQADQFCIFGGSAQAHQHLTTCFMKALHALETTGKSLEELEPEEILNLLNKQHS